MADGSFPEADRRLLLKDFTLNHGDFFFGVLLSSIVARCGSTKPCGTASEEDVVVSLATGSWLWGDKIAVLPNHSGESSAVPVGVPPSAVLGDIGSFVLVLPPEYIVNCPLCSS